MKSIHETRFTNRLREQNYMLSDVKVYAKI